MLKKVGPFLDLCVSSLRRGHANLLCSAPPILSDLTKGTSLVVCLFYIHVKYLGDVGLKANKQANMILRMQCIYTYYFSTHIHLKQPSKLLLTKKKF